jgi:hypothetical protein
MSDKPAPDSRRFEKIASDDPRLPEFVEWVNAVDKDAWLYYLCECGLNAHLARFAPASPFERSTHASNRMSVLIAQFLRADKDRANEFLWAIQTYIKDHRLIQKHFDYVTPEELYGPQTNSAVPGAKAGEGHGT